MRRRREPHRARGRAQYHLLAARALGGAVLVEAGRRAVRLALPVGQVPVVGRPARRRLQLVLLLVRARARPNVVGAVACACTVSVSLVVAGEAVGA